MKHSASSFSRIPCDLALDLRVSDSAVRAFAIIAAPLRYTDTAYIGQRLLGELLGISAATAGRRLAELAKYGYVEKAKTDKRGQRAHWVLTSKVFSQHKGKSDKIVSSPSGNRRLATIDNERHGLPTKKTA